MKDNIFRTNLHQESGDRYIHDDAFEIRDTDSTHPTQGWPGEGSHSKSPVHADDQQMLNTIREFGSRLDDVCAEDDHTRSADADPMGMTDTAPFITDELDVLLVENESDQR